MLISDFIILLLVIGIISFVMDLIAAKMMEKAARKKGYGEDFNCFWTCFWLGPIGWLYVISLPDLRQRAQFDKIINLLTYQSIAPPTQQDTVWTAPKKWLPESPKRDGSAEEYLRMTKKTPEEYACDRLIIVKKIPVGDCSVCKRRRKKVKFCRTIKDNAPIDGFICTDCINVFIEYNPKSVFDLDSTLPE